MLLNLPLHKYLKKYLSTAKLLEKTTKSVRITLQ